MAIGNVQELVKQGLTAMKAGSNIAAQATAEISNDVKAPAPAIRARPGQQDVQAMGGAHRPRHQAGRRRRSGRQPDPAGPLRGQPPHPATGPDDLSRDLGVIASGLLALHYWIAAFGTMASYTKQLGITEVASAIKQSCDEAKEADEKHTSLAKEILAA